MVAFAQPDLYKADMSENPEVWYVRPVFFAADCEVSLRFYAALGYRESWRFEEDGRILVVQVTRNDFELILNRRSERIGSGRLFFELYPEQLKQCLSAFVSAGITVRDSYWGMPVKAVNDPDGNELFFAVDEGNRAS